MPIQINEFEIEVEEPPVARERSAGGDAGEQQQQAAQKMRPEEVISAARLGHERVERVRAD